MVDSEGGSRSVCEESSFCEELASEDFGWRALPRCSTEAKEHYRPFWCDPNRLSDGRARAFRLSPTFLRWLDRSCGGLCHQLPAAAPAEIEG